MPACEPDLLELPGCDLLEDLEERLRLLRCAGSRSAAVCRVDQGGVPPEMPHFELRVVKGTPDIPLRWAATMPS